MTSSPALLIGEVAELAGVTVKTVRHYEKLGLIAPDRREDNGYRRFSGATVVRVACIAYLRGLVVPLSETQGLVAGDAETNLDVVIVVLEDERARLTERIERLKKVSLGAVDHAATACARRGRGDGGSAAE